MLSPVVRSHCSPQPDRSRPEACSSAPMQVGERGVAPRVRGEVAAQPGQERLQPDVGDELLEHRRALGVGDAVEVDLDGLQVGDVGGHRVGGGQLVLPVGPALLDVGERRPRLGVLGGVGLAEHRRERGERLVEPQVVPPAHGDEVAEPHVRHLVQHGLGAPLVHRARDAGAEDVVLEERDGGRVLHRARVELRHEQLVVLAERVPHAEVLVEEPEALLGLAEEALGVHVLRRATRGSTGRAGCPPPSSEYTSCHDAYGPAISATR